jgi:amino acid transporter
VPGSAQSGRGAQSGELGERNLRLPDVVAQSIGFMGPVFSVAFLLPLIVGAGNSGKGAGVATPIAVVLAAVGTAGIASMISRYARRIRACGALYDYVSAAAGPSTGVTAGWVYYGAAIAGFAIDTIIIVSGTLSDFLTARLDVHIAWWVIALIMTALVYAIVCRGVRISTRVQLVLVAVSALLVLCFSLWIIAKGGVGGNSLKPFDPTASSFQGILFGVVYGIALFIGFETAANLAEETENPRRAIPRALLLAIGLGTLYFVICAYSQAIGFGLNGKAWAQSGAPLFVLGADPRFGSQTLSDILTVLVVLDGLAVAIGAWVATTRGVLGLARDRRIPASLARTHPRYGTPIAAATLVAFLTVVVVLVVHLTGGLLSRATPDPKVLLPEYYPVFTWLATFGPLLFVFVYLMISVAGVWHLWGTEKRPGLVTAGVLGTAVSIGAMFGLVYKAPSPVNTVPLFAGGWLLAGIALTIWLRRKGSLVRGSAEAPSGSPTEHDDVELVSQ